jgi:hypothetical protein
VSANVVRAPWATTQIAPRRRRFERAEVSFTKRDVWRCARDDGKEFSNMEAVIEIPSPTPRDSETVVTALETAAVFRAKGDGAEALRWLQRAAESAGDDGDDERTLTLALTAADLSRALRQPVLSAPAHLSSDQHTPTHSRRLPKPPLRAGSGPLAAEGVEPHNPLSQRPPLPPSSRPAPPSASRAYNTSAASSRAPSSPSRAAPPQSRLPTPPSLGSTPTRIEMRVSDAPALPDADADADADARLTQPVIAPSVAHSGNASGGVRLRKAARVSVVASPVEPGLFLVRLLEDGSAPPANATEALMVLVDPSSTVFSD